MMTSIKLNLLSYYMSEPINKPTSKLQKAVAANPHFEFLENGKIRCLLTMHEFLPTQEQFKAYLASKSYKKGLEADFELGEHSEYLVQHKQGKHFLYCKITGVRLPNKKTAVIRHVNSKGFKAKILALHNDTNQAEQGREQERDEGNGKRHAKKEGKREKQHKGEKKGEKEQNEVKEKKGENENQKKGEKKGENENQKKGEKKGENENQKKGENENQKKGEKKREPKLGEEGEGVLAAPVKRSKKQRGG